MFQSSFTEFADVAGQTAVRGFLHLPAEASGDSLILTHGAGANCQSKLLVAVASAFAAEGFTVLRCDLPFRQSRPKGPPFPATAARDREGLRRAVQVLRQRTPGRIFLGGHSYGGRQATMLAAEDPQLADGLLLLSYPLHPPRKPQDLRTAHFPQLSTPALFVHGLRDPFATPEEMNAALKLVSGRTILLEVEGVGHELLPKKDANGMMERVVTNFDTLINKSGTIGMSDVRLV